MDGLYGVRPLFDSGRGREPLSSRESEEYCVVVNAIMVGRMAKVPRVSAILLVVALVYHSSLGTQVVAEDYVHASGRRAIVLIVLRLLHVGLAAAGIFAVFLIATRAPL